MNPLPATIHCSSIYSTTTLHFTFCSSIFYILLYLHVYRVLDLLGHLPTSLQHLAFCILFECRSLQHNPGLFYFYSVSSSTIFIEFFLFYTSYIYMTCHNYSVDTVQRLMQGRHFVRKSGGNNFSRFNISIAEDKICPSPGCWTSSTCMKNQCIDLWTTNVFLKQWTPNYSSRCDGILSEFVPLCTQRAHRYWYSRQNME